MLVLGNMFWLKKLSAKHLKSPSQNLGILETIVQTLYVAKLELPSSFFKNELSGVEVLMIICDFDKT